MAISVNKLLTQTSARGDCAPPVQNGGAGAPLVLVVEDHEDTLFLLTYLLKMRGCHVETALDGEAALRLAECLRPALILMDISLPRLDGLAATRRMRKVEALKGVPVVFLSGHADAAFRREALRHGGDDYLIKPFALSELERVLDKYVVRQAAAMKA